MKRIYFDTEEEVKTIKRKGYIEIEDSYTQVYDNLSKLSVMVKSLTELQFLFYIFTKANDEGIFHTDEITFKRFNQHLLDSGGAIIVRGSFTNLINNLTKIKIIVKLNKGQYQLNPLVIWRDTIIKREEIIEMICTESDKDKYILQEELPVYKLS